MIVVTGEANQRVNDHRLHDHRVHGNGELHRTIASVVQAERVDQVGMEMLRNHGNVVVGTHPQDLSMADLEHMAVMERGDQRMGEA